jgi:hypothetical protein
MVKMCLVSTRFTCWRLDFENTRKMKLMNVEAVLGLGLGLGVIDNSNLEFSRVRVRVSMGYGQ